MISTVEIGSVEAPELHRVRTGANSTLCGKDLFAGTEHASFQGLSNTGGACPACLEIARSYLI